MNRTAIIQHLRRFSLFAVAALCLGTAVRAGDSLLNNSPGAKPATEEEPAKKSKLKSQVAGTRNNHVVKIYPDMIRRDMHVVAKETGVAEMDFYVFDLNGNLVLRKKMKERDHQRISGLARGTYLYRVFIGDRETAAGEFEIR